MKIDVVKLQSAADMLLEALHLNLEDPNFKDTPRRIVNMYKEIFAGEVDEQAEVTKLLGVVFPSKYDGMVVSKGVRAYSMCGHHLLPIVLDVVIGYIPDKSVLGLSKLARLAELLAKKPLIQEDYTEQLARLMHEVLKPKGVGVYVNGLHYCQTMRGAKQRNAIMTTSYVMGCFRSDEKTRNEFLTDARRSVEIGS